jgi:GR25 family glycosyltransferase involved in LPS biosynthesis
MELFKHTFYINLDHRTDRLENIHQQLLNLKIDGERIPAIRTKVGSIGCTLSHIKCLELARERGYEQIFICEDDIMFLEPDVLKDSSQKIVNNKELEWDVLLIGGNNLPPYEKVGDYCIRVSNCQTTTGYIVKRHYYDTLIRNFRDSAHKLLKEPMNGREFALDIYWKRLQKEGRWYMITPLTVVQCDSYSDIENRNVDYRHLMLDIDKEWFFRKR